MIKLLSSLKNCNKYLIKVSVRDGTKVLSGKRVLAGPKWKAEEIEVELKKELRKKRGLDSDLDNFKDVLDYYEQNHFKFTKSYADCVSYLKRLRNDLGSLRINEITAEKFRAYLRQDVKCIRKKSNYKNASLNRLLDFAKSALNFAVANGKISENLLTKSKMRLPEEQRNRIMSDVEWIALQQHLPEWLEPIVTFAYMVPSRLGELRALKRSWIDGDKIWLPGEKTKTGMPRYLPVPPVMKPYIESIPKESEYVFFRKEKDSYLSMKRIRTDEGDLGAAFKAAQIADFRFHDFRHTAASNLRKKGIRIELIMAIGGWTAVPTFFRYSNYSSEELLAAYA